MWLNQSQGKEEVEKIRDALRRSKPYGSEKWVSKAVARFGLESTLWNPWRPAKVAKRAPDPLSLFYRDVRTELKRAGTPIPSNDVWIAALSRQHRLPLLSRDRHFDAVPGIRRLAW